MSAARWGIVLVTLAWGAASRPVAADYLVSNLGTLPLGSRSVGLGVNGQGWVTGQSDVGGSSPAQHAFIWTGKTGMVDIGTVPGYTTYVGNAINDNNRVAGTLSNNNGMMHAFRTEDTGKISDLGTLSGSGWSVGNAINNMNQVAGTSTTADGQVHAFRTAGGGSLQDLGTLGGVSSEAAGINASGAVVGTSSPMRARTCTTSGRCPAA